MDGTGGRASIWDDAVAQSAAIRRGDVSATELLEEYLARIERHDEALRAYVSVDIDGARRAAHTADTLTAQVRPEDLPPFHGVTLSVKDVVDVAGLPTTHSSKVLADSVAIVDGPVVSRFRDAGFVIVGKTNVPEFCTSMTSSELNGTARNPWDPERTPGGSSGGAAASVAAGLCAVAHGTDGAGSVRSPASFCGLVGVKPTRGLVNFGPEVGNPYYGTTVDGVLTRSVRDAASLLDVLLGPRDPATAWSPRPAERYAALALRAPGVAARCRQHRRSVRHLDTGVRPCRHDDGCRARVARSPGRVRDTRLVHDPGRGGRADVRPRRGGAGGRGRHRTGRASEPAAGSRDVSSHRPRARAVGRAGAHSGRSVPRLLGYVRPSRHSHRRDRRPAGVLGTLGPGSRSTHGDVHGLPELRPTVQPLRATGAEPAPRLERLRAADRRAPGRSPPR